jgi:hypothetical protein
MADPYDAHLTTFLTGRFARESLRLTLDGLLISDLATMDIDDFLVGVEARDYHLARVFWVKVLTPVWEAWTAWRALEKERVAVDEARRRLQNAMAAAQGNGLAPNDRLGPGPGH